MVCEPGLTPCARPLVLALQGGMAVGKTSAARWLAALRQCMPRRILFLDAPDPVLRRRKEGDAARDRGFFEHSLTALLPLKRAWFAQKDNVDVLDTARLTPDETGAAVRDWVARQRAKAE